MIDLGDFTPVAISLVFVFLTYVVYRLSTK